MNDAPLTNPSDNWDKFYAQPDTRIQQLIDSSVCGCDYYGSSWMDAEEAMELAVLMKLGPGRHLLDIGSGAGWPALYQSGNTGCRATLTDISGEGLRASRKKAATEELSDRYQCVQTGAERLPFRNGSFDAIGHADVLCCMVEKLEALSECRRVIGDRGTMAFSVLHMRPGADTGETKEAAAAGPSEIAAASNYPEMLSSTGWKIEISRNITDGYAAILTKLKNEYEQHVDTIVAQRGEEYYQEELEKCLAKQRCVAAGSVKRSLYTVVPAN
jgi:ubiquinone/menaquinone biosynthesis C-methylase UbiE